MSVSLPQISNYFKIILHIHIFYKVRSDLLHVFNYWKKVLYTHIPWFPSFHPRWFTGVVWTKSIDSHELPLFYHITWKVCRSSSLMHRQAFFFAGFDLWQEHVHPLACHIRNAHPGGWCWFANSKSNPCEGWLHSSGLLRWKPGKQIFPQAEYPW